MQHLSTNKNSGLGFFVENMLNDFNNVENEKNRNDEIMKKKETEWCEREKRYNETKQTILDIYSKIRRRKNYNYNHICNNKNKTDVYINYSKVREQYRELLKLLYAETKNDETKHRAEWHIVMLYRLLAFTRDISDGCGERELAYMQVFELARMDAGAACEALKTIVTSKTNSKTMSPLGSWKDVKGLVAYMRRTMNMRDDQDMAAYLELMKFAVNLVNQRVAKDVLAFYKDDSESVGNGNKDNNEEVSFVSKWIPRENKSKKYGNFYERLACDYYKDWLPKDRNANPISYEKAVVKCKIHYRKLVSTLNQYLETPQIKMCQQRWSDIAFSKTTRLTRDLQNRAFLNLRSDDHRIKRHADDTDRVTCAEKYKVWKCDTINRINGIKTDLETHVRVVKYSACSSLAFNRNAEWAAFASQEALKNKLSRVIPVLAGSSHKAIGLALATAENATTGKTIIVKDCNAVNLYHLDASFVQNVKHLSNTVQLRCSPTFSVYCHPLYKCLISGLKLLIESNVAANQTRNSEDPEFTMTIFTDDDSGIFFNDEDDDGVSFEEVRNEASLLYREFGYGVPNVVVWAMTSTVCMNTDNNNNDDNNNDIKKEMVSYNSVSYGGALTLQVGCDKNDICKYLGLENINQEEMGNKYRYYNNNHNNQCNEWQSEWNHLVETLYNPRYYYFEKHFWKK